MLLSVHTWVTLSTRALSAPIKQRAGLVLTAFQENVEPKGPGLFQAFRSYFFLLKPHIGFCHANIRTIRFTPKKKSSLAFFKCQSSHYKIELSDHNNSTGFNTKYPTIRRCVWALFSHLLPSWFLVINSLQESVYIWKRYKILSFLFFKEPLGKVQTTCCFFKAI